MPRRILDGEAIWTSKKLAVVEPQWARAEYANMLPLALANGVFECDPKLVWARVYSYNRPYFTEDEVKTALAAFERAKMLYRWRDGASKEWGYWVGIEKAGRLPSASLMQRKSYRCGPPPPREEIAKWLDDVKTLSTSGIGIGIGIGFGKDSFAASPLELVVTQSAQVKATPQDLLEIWQTERGALPAVLGLDAKRLSKCHARLSSNRFSLESFKAAVQKANGSAFLTGQTGRWKASFDWFIANDRNHMAVLEGSYDNGNARWPTGQEAARGTLTGVGPAGAKVKAGYTSRSG